MKENWPFLREKKLMVTYLDLIKCLKQIKSNILLLRCAPISELPSNIRTMLSHGIIVSWYSSGWLNLWFLRKLRICASSNGLTVSYNKVIQLYFLKLREINYRLFDLNTLLSVQEVHFCKVSILWKLDFLDSRCRDNEVYLDYFLTIPKLVFLFLRVGSGSGSGTTPSGSVTLGVRCPLSRKETTPQAKSMIHFHVFILCTMLTTSFNGPESRNTWSTIKSRGCNVLLNCRLNRVWSIYTM